MKKIVVIAGYAESLLNFRGQLLVALVSKRYQVVAIAPGSDDKIVQQLTDIGIIYEPIQMARAGLNPLADLATFLQLRKILKRLAPDLVLSYTIKPVIYGSIAAASAGVPEIYSMITGLGYLFSEDDRKRWLLRTVISRLYRRALRLNKKVFFQNPDDRRLFEQVGILPATQQAALVNGSGVDLQYFQLAPLPKTPPLSFMLIARLLADKGIAEYVLAAQIIKKKYPATEFHLVGALDPNPAAIKKSTLDSWVASEIISYHGQVTDVRALLAKTAVYVLPSYREGIPRTVLEAMAMGRPIITTHAPGCRETVVEGENGFLAKVKSVDSLVEMMERFIVNPDLLAPMGQRSRQLAELKYDVHKINSFLLTEMGLNC